MIVQGRDQIHLRDMEGETPCMSMYAPLLCTMLLCLPKSLRCRFAPETKNKFLRKMFLCVSHQNGQPYSRLSHGFSHLLSLNITEQISSILNQHRKRSQQERFSVESSNASSRKNDRFFRTVDFLIPLPLNFSDFLAEWGDHLWILMIDSDFHLPVAKATCAVR